MAPGDCSPHARGWSLPDPPTQDHEELLPARAGMVPTRLKILIRMPAAPRTRGDGPHIVVPSTYSRYCSPHARGWSPRVVLDAVQFELLPARAGMVPRKGRPDATRTAAPRTRGDGPATGRYHSSSTACSPHARGWSLRHRVPRGRRRLLPARAGMVPPRCLIGEDRGPAPRTRGDGPNADAPGKLRVRCSPHARGWSPGSRRSTNPPSCSPHARGWSRQVGPAERPGRLLPARAGMVPSRPQAWPTGSAAPRSPGDGPSVQGQIDKEADCSSYARGWSQPGHTGSHPVPPLLGRRCIRRLLHVTARRHALKTRRAPTGGVAGALRDVGCGVA